MPTATITADAIIRRYADDIAYVAERDPAADLSAFIDHLNTAVPRYSMAGINGHEDLEAASTLLEEALHADDDTARTVFLKRADKLLRNVDDMTAEYREMVGD